MTVFDDTPVGYVTVVDDTPGGYVTVFDDTADGCMTDSVIVDGVIRTICLLMT